MSLPKPLVAFGPQGMSEKSKLTLHFLQRKTEEYERLKIEIEQLKRQIG
jgi:hypothetical protein